MPIPRPAWSACTLTCSTCARVVDHLGQRVRTHHAPAAGRRSPSYAARITARPSSAICPGGRASLQRVRRRTHRTAVGRRPGAAPTGRVAPAHHRVARPRPEQDVLGGVAPQQVAPRTRGCRSRARGGSAAGRRAARDPRPSPCGAAGRARPRCRPPRARPGARGIAAVDHPAVGRAGDEGRERLAPLLVRGGSPPRQVVHGVELEVRHAEPCGQRPREGGLPRSADTDDTDPRRHGGQPRQPRAS